MMSSSSSIFLLNSIFLCSLWQSRKNSSAENACKETRDWLGAWFLTPLCYYIHYYYYWISLCPTIRGVSLVLIFWIPKDLLESCFPSIEYSNFLYVWYPPVGQQREEGVLYKSSLPFCKDRPHHQMFHRWASPRMNDFPPTRVMEKAWHLLFLPT